MPKPKRKSESSAEFQAKSFPARISRVKNKAKMTLNRTSGASTEERARAQKALNAANRVEKRMGGGKKKGKPTTKKEATAVAALLKLASLPTREKKALGKIADQTAKTAGK
jgi:hypothetical protein